MEVFTVGGAVRDELMGLEPKDIDYVVVGATPDDMLSMGFSQVGADFPVFLHPTTGDEYALARTERKVGDGYHGFEVNADVTVTLAEDLARRDLTINAMAKDAHGEIYDPLGGRADLENKVLRHASPAFAEDPLRVVRLARFYARYTDFTISLDTLQLAQTMVKNGDLNHLPHERFWAELTKVFGEKRPARFFEVMASTFMDRHVTFFKELYGEFDHSYDTNPKANTLFKSAVVLKHVMLNVQGAEDRLMFHTAITAIDGKTIQTAPTRTKNLFNNIQRWRQLPPAGTVNDIARRIFQVLKQAKAWSQATDIDDLIHAIDIMNENAAAREMHQLNSAYLNAADWENMVEVTRAVTSVDFPGVEGKALGDAIMQGRIKNIEDYLME